MKRKTPVAKRTRKWSDRWPAVVTREGKGFLWLTVGVAFAALNTGNNLLYLVLSFMLSLLLLSMILAESGIRSLDVERKRPGAIFCGEPSALRYRISGRRRWLPVFAVEVRELHQDVKLLRPAWAPKTGVDRQDVRAQIVFERRGLVHLQQFQVRSSFPFGLVEKRRWFRQPQELVVYPNPADNDLGELAKLNALGDRPAALGLRTEMGELREYVPGDPIRSVHWLRSAAVGELIARDHVAQKKPELIVDLGQGLPPRTDSVWRTMLEERICGATRLVLDAARDTAAVSIHYGEQHAQLVAGGSDRAVLRFLALLELEKGGA